MNDVIHDVPQVDRELATEALMQLGVKKKQAEQYVDNAVGYTTEEVIKNALSAREKDRTIKPTETIMIKTSKNGDQTLPPPDDSDIIPMTVGAQMSETLKQRSQWMIDREERIQAGIDAGLDMLAAIEEIREHPEEYKRLGFAKFADYFQARWGRTVSNYYHKSRQIKWWKDIMLPALADAGVECTTVHMPTERASRPAVYAQDQGTAAKKIAQEVKAKNLKRIDSKVIDRHTKSSKQRIPQERVRSYSKSTKPQPESGEEDGDPGYTDEMIYDYIGEFLKRYPRKYWADIVAGFQSTAERWQDELFDRNDDHNVDSSWGMTRTSPS